MAFACCCYSFPLSESQRVENTALDMRKSKMGSHDCGFWKNGDGGRFGQEWVNVNEKDSQDNTYIHRKNHQWRKKSIPVLRLRYKRLCLTLCGILYRAVYHLRI